MKSYLQLVNRPYFNYWNTLKDINQNMVKAKYVLRGLIPTMAAEIQTKIHLGVPHPFESITELNIGNPQIFGQKPISFNRSVLASLLDPTILKHQPIDVQRRVHFYQNEIKVSCGAYSQFPGYPIIREAVANFIQKRDQSIHKPKIENILLTDGASQGITLMFNILLSPGEGVMIPIPQYPLYSALISQCGAYQIPYYLSEQTGWSIENSELNEKYDAAVAKGVKPKILVCINPGNPTGQIFDYKTMELIVRFASQKKLTILADEVYQENIYHPTKKFISFRRVAEELNLDCEIYSFHSISKGIYGECGLRGGYMEISTKIDKEVHNEIHKTKSILICPNTIGQIMTGLMVTPPNSEEGCSQETIQTYQNEINALHSSMKQRATIVNNVLNSTKGISSQPIEGAMYAFPTLTLSQKFIDHAKSLNQEPDDYYCIELLKATGLVVIPGTGFHQYPGTYHFRMTILLMPENTLEAKMIVFKQWHEALMAQYELQ